MMGNLKLPLAVQWPYLVIENSGRLKSHRCTTLFTIFQYEEKKVALILRYKNDGCRYNDKLHM